MRLHKISECAEHTTITLATRGARDIQKISVNLKVCGAHDNNFSYTWSEGYSKDFRNEISVVCEAHDNNFSYTWSEAERVVP